MSENAMTESEARRLLGAAASTVHVEDQAPLALAGPPESRPHRRWSLLVAVAACVALLASVAWVVARQLGDGQQVPPAPVERPTAGEHAYGPGRVPSVVGGTESEARSILEAAGYRAVVEEHGFCTVPAGLVRGTDPTAGAALAPGGRVRISVAADAGADCARPSATGPVWDLVRQARGFSGPNVCAGRACATVLPVMAELATRPERLEVAEYDQSDLRCLALARAPDPGVRRYVVHVGWRTGTLTGVCPSPPVIQVDVGRDGVVSTRVRGALPDTADLTMLPEPTSVRRASALRFVHWARTGTAAPTFSSRVRNLTPGFAPDWNDRPADRASWSGCSGLGFPDCGIDPVATASRSVGAIELATGIPPCPGADHLAGQWAVEDDVVRLSAPGFACDGWYVLLWIDEGGVVYGVM